MIAIPLALGLMRCRSTSGNAAQGGNGFHPTSIAAADGGTTRISTVLVPDARAMAEGDRT